MTTEEQDSRASGSVPNAFGNALAWRWAPAMPTALKRGGFLTLLYALRAMANVNGELRFNGDHKPIRIQDIAKATGSNEKDTRRYLRVAIAAGLVGVKGEARRGKATLYTLIVSPWPDWAAAEAELKNTRWRPEKTSAPWDQDKESSGPRDPNKNGSPRPELTDGTADEVRVPATRMGSGPRDPIGSGPRDPNNPGIAKELPQETAEVVGQPEVVGGPGPEDHIPAQGQDTHAPPPAVAQPQPPPLDLARCARCHERMVPRPGRTTHAHCQPLTDAERTAS